VVPAVDPNRERAKGITHRSNGPHSTLGRSPAGTHAVAGSDDETTALTSVLRKSGDAAKHGDCHAPFARTEFGGTSARGGRRSSLSPEDDVRGRSREPRAVTVTDDKARAKDVGVGAKHELRTADAARARYDETTKFSKSGQSHAFRSSSSNPRAVVPENKTAHPGAVPPHHGTNVIDPGRTSILLKPDGDHDEDRVATAKAGRGTDVARSEEGIAHRSNCPHSVHGQRPGSHVVAGNGDKPTTDPTLVPIHRKSGYAASHGGDHAAPFTRVVDPANKTDGGGTVGRSKRPNDRSSRSHEDDVRGRSRGARAVVGTNDEACARDVGTTLYSRHYSTAVLLAHALLLGLGLGLLGCACVLLLPVLMLLLPRVWGRRGSPPRPRRPRRTTSTSRRGPGPPQRRSKLTRMRMNNPPFWVCALALLSRYFSLAGAAPLTDTTFKQASWGT